MAREDQTLAETQDPDHHESEPGSRTLVSCCARRLNTVEDDPGNYTLSVGTPTWKINPFPLPALSIERIEWRAAKR